MTGKRRASNKAAPKPKQVAAAAPIPEQIDPADAAALRELARHDMLDESELDKRPELFDDIYPPASRQAAKDWRSRHGRF